MATVINRVSNNATGNLAMGVGQYDPAKIRGAIFHPFDADLLSTANAQTATLRKTNLQNLLINATYANRAFFVHKLIMPENNGEAVQYETREQLKKQTDKGTWDMIFTVEQTWAEYQMLRKFHLRKGLSVAFIDENNVLRHINTATGIAGFDVHEISVPAITEPVTGAVVKYQLRIALADIDQINGSACKHTELGFNPFSPTTGLLGVQDWVLEDVTPGGASAGVFDFALYGADSQKLLVDKYSAVLNVAGAWDVRAADDNAAITVSSVTVVTTSGEKVAFRLTLDTSDTDYDIGDTLNVKLASIATLSTTYNIKYAETNTVNVTAN